MIGQFIIPTCEVAGLRTTALLRNTSRAGETIPRELRERGMSVDVRVFERGRLCHHAPEFGTIPYGGVLEVSEESCPAIRATPGGPERLVVARCSLPDGTDAPFAQEHQLRYVNRTTGVYDSLLYDQLPVPSGAPKRPPSPIVLLAPKVWIGEHFTAYVTFANTTGAMEYRMQPTPLSISVMAADGHPLASVTVEEPENSVLAFDVREAVRGRLPLGAEPTFVNVVAKGGASFYAVMTFFQNTRTGNFALEHSLSPHYYMSGDMQRVRREALAHFAL